MFITNITAMILLIVTVIVILTMIMNVIGKAMQIE